MMAHSRTGIAAGADVDALAGLLRRLWRGRFIAPLCAMLVCAGLTAAGLLAARADRSRADAEAARFAQTRIADLARMTGAALDRYARLGRAYAETRDGEIARIEPGLSNIAVRDESGATLAVLDGKSSLPFPALGRAQHALFAGGLALRDGRRIILVLFDPASLLPASLLTHAALMNGDNVFIAGTDWRGTGAIRAAVPGWPLAVAADAPGAGRRHDSPLLDLALVLGPMLAGAWGAALLVGGFERRQRRARARAALLGASPQEARLLVRLANAERGAAEALRSKAEFIAHMSHEMRTPLNAIIGFSDIIVHGFFGAVGHPKYAEYARDIGDAGRGLHARIGGILEFANIEAGCHPLSARPLDLAALAQACIAAHQGRAFSRRIDLAAGLCEPGMVLADAAAVQRIFANLIANALAYTREGGTVRLEVRFEEGAGVALLRDSGMGFSASERRKAGRVFQRFDRPGAVTGAGLGLAIAVELARRMGGAMRLASQPGGGSIMELRLPRVR